MKSDKLFLKFLFPAAFILLFLPVINAQNNPQPNRFSSKWQITFHGGTSLFFGDIKQNKWWPVSTDVNEWHYAGGLSLEYQISPAFAVGLQGLYGNLSGTRRSWGIYFDNNYFETNLYTNINFNNLFGPNRVSRFFSVYGVMGIGLMQYNTQVKDLESGLVINTQGEGSGKGIKGRTLEGILIYGLGFNFRLNDHWAIHLESVNRIMNSDALDGFVNSYPYDVYNYTSLGLVYKFGVGKKKINEEEVSPLEEPEVVPLVVPVDTASQIQELVDTLNAEEAVPNVEPEEITAVEPVAASEQPATQGLNYRVQILARFTGPLSVEYISHEFKIPANEIKEETFQGHFIYTVGAFETYDEARIKRDEIRYYYGVKDAFVVAFNKGVRLEQLPDAE
ncbi:MAG TPA: hypothetical protein ENH02_03405 [Bacteroidetes bacterium]|nr:hypothetical protein [Bacteroidota bacterium]